MKQEVTSTDTARLMPCGFQPRTSIHRAKTLLGLDAAAMGIVHAQQPSVDEILAVIQCRPGDLMQWCETGASQDSLFERARSRGAACASAQELSHPMPTGEGHTMVIVVPHSLLDGTVWWLCASRRDRPFGPDDERIGEALVRTWQAGFGERTEPAVQRLVIGHDDRLIASDPWTVRQLVEDPSHFDRLLEQFHAAVSQRWPSLGDDDCHDLFVENGERVSWIVFHRTRCVDAAQAMHWYLEIRPSLNEEMPAVSGVSDVRIAKALAFLHDHYHETPSLSETADVVHVSPFHFHRLFTREVGISPKHYLQRKQLQVARWLLRTSRMPVGSIASHIGFASHGHFTSTFHRVVGVSPTEYRETH